MYTRHCEEADVQSADEAIPRIKAFLHRIASPTARNDVQLILASCMTYGFARNDERLQTPTSMTQ